MTTEFYRHLDWEFAEPGNKPQCPVEIDHAHPLADRLISYSLFDGGDVDLITGLRATKDSDVTEKFDGYQFSRSGNSYYDPELNFSINNYTNFTCIAKMRIDDASDGAHIVSSRAGGTGNNTRLYIYQTGSNLRCYVGNGYESAGPCSDGGIYTIGVARDGSTCQAWRNGELNSSGSISVSGSTTGEINFGNYPPGRSTSNAWDGKLYYVAMWDRTLSAAEHKSFYNDPYQFLVPK